MVQIATSRIFLFFALLLATVLIVSGVSMFAVRADTADTKGANSWSIASVVGFFQRVLPGSASPSPTPLESPEPEEDTDQIIPGNVLGVSATSVKAFPSVVYAAYPPSPFAPIAAPEAVALEGEADMGHETAPSNETTTEGEEAVESEPKKLGYIKGTEPTPTPTAAPVAS